MLYWASIDSCIIKTELSHSQICVIIIGKEVYCYSGFLSLCCCFFGGGGGDKAKNT